MGGGSQKNTEKTEPWAGQQPYLLNAFSEAQNIYNTKRRKQTPGYKGEFVDTADAGERGQFSNALFDGSGANSANGLFGLGCPTERRGCWSPFGGPKRPQGLQQQGLDPAAYPRCRPVRQ
jgi:hypothetical protein